MEKTRPAVKFGRGRDGLVSRRHRTSARSGAMFHHHQQNGMLNPQMLQMQRLMGASSSVGGGSRRATGTAFMGTGEIGSPLDLNEHQFASIPQMGGIPHLNQQRSFGGGIPQMSASFGSGMHSQPSHVMSGTFVGNAGMRAPVFKCPECAIVKNTNEELEVHIKTEHLGWLPFQCPICSALRASDLQMREHIHSHHKKSENKYIYVDNAPAKRILQEWMDRALFGASQQLQQQHVARRTAFANGPASLVNGAQMVGHGGAMQQGSTFGMAAKRARGREGEEDGGQQQLAKRNCLGGDDDSSLLARMQQRSAMLHHQNSVEAICADMDSQDGSNGATAQQDQQQQQLVDDETDTQLSNIFGRNLVKSEFDMSAMDEPDDSSPSNEAPGQEEDDLPDDQSHQLDALQNVAQMFSASAAERIGVGGAQSGAGGRSFGHQHYVQRNGGGFSQKRIVRNRPGPMTSKKRVLGMCADCNKPITAGARQMHMFFHLGKDLNTFRFRCRHAGCKVEHYRKDQMENHQSKAHGKVDPDMMDDRSMELFNQVQNMSLKLLGTTGNTPGPTAARAQQVYEQQMREIEANLGGMRRRRRPDYSSPSMGSSGNNNFHHSGGGGLNNASAQSSSGAHMRASGVPAVDAGGRKLEDLECRMCHKFIMSRIRGFHILWHLSNDLGIVRYGCKHCAFKHDRPQSVVAHAAREHGDNDACEDNLYNFEGELISMSKACFGVERLFEKEIRRRNRMERSAANQSPHLSLELDEDEEEEEEEYSQQGSDSKQSSSAGLMSARRSGGGTQIGNLKVPLRVENERSWSAAKEPPKKRRPAVRRFGTRSRRPMSRRAREGMVKLREVSMRLGGAQYFKKRSSEAVPCEKCGKLVVNRLSDHAYSHMDGCDLFRCQQCNLGHYSRETIVRHLKDFHGSHEAPMDNRLRFAQEIKDAIRDCYPRLFVDAPIPTKEDIEKLRTNLNLSDQVLVCDKDEGEEEEQTPEQDDAEEDEEAEEMEEAKEKGEEGEEEHQKSGTGDEEEEEMENEEEEEEEEELDNDEEDEDYQQEEEEEDVEDEEQEQEGPPKLGAEQQQEHLQEEAVGGEEKAAQGEEAN